MAMITLKIGVIMLRGPFFTYLDRFCIGFLTQVSGHIMLRKREIKNAFCLCVTLNCFSFNHFELCIEKMKCVLALRLDLKHCAKEGMLYFSVCVFWHKIVQLARIFHHYLKSKF